MKNKNKYLTKISKAIIFCCLAMTTNHLFAQDSTASAAVDSTANEPVEKPKKAFVKNTFEGNYFIDNQSVMVPMKGTLEFDIQHRFGTVNNGIRDLFGLFASATMRLGISYVPVKNLQIGFGGCNDRMQVDLNVKYALLKQTKNGSMPVSITYFGNVVMDTRKADATTLFVTSSDRLSFFNQIIIARKITEKLSLQVAPSLSHFNNLPGYTDASTGKIMPQFQNDHFAIAFGGRYKISQKTGITFNYDQPLTQHPMNNPHPNISFGLDMSTSGHDFQVFAGNYGMVLPQNNNLFNQNDYTKGQFVIGFNITRLWNF